MEIKLTQQEAQALLNYLATKPYAEVYQMINILVERMPKQEEIKDDNKK